MSKLDLTKDTVTQARIRHLEDTLEDHERAIEMLHDLVRTLRARLDGLPPTRVPSRAMDDPKGFPEW